MATKKNYILDASTIRKKLKRLALEVVENNLDKSELIFVGIEENGVVLAKHVKKLVEEQLGINIRLLTLKLNKRKPGKIELSEEMDFTGKAVFLIDDVTNSGKTLLYALKPFLEYHPKKIRTLVLVERSHTMFPIGADYKGYSLATTLQEHIFVEVEGNNITGAYLG